MQAKQHDAAVDPLDSPSTRSAIAVPWHGGPASRLTPCFYDRVAAGEAMRLRWCGPASAACEVLMLGAAYTVRRQGRERVYAVRRALPDMLFRLLIHRQCRAPINSAWPSVTHRVCDGGPSCAAFNGP